MQAEAIINNAKSTGNACFVRLNEGAKPRGRLLSKLNDMLSPLRYAQVESLIQEHALSQNEQLAILIVW